MYSNHGAALRVRCGRSDVDGDGGTTAFFTGVFVGVFALAQGLTLAYFRAQLEDLRERIAHVTAQPEHLRDTSTD
jgi:hypothetical protein